MSGLGKPSQFGRWNQSDVARASSADNNGLLLIYDLVEHAGEILAKAGISRFTRHAFLGFTAFVYVCGYGRAVPPSREHYAVDVMPTCMHAVAHQTHDIRDRTSHAPTPYNRFDRIYSRTAGGTSTDQSPAASLRRISDDDAGTSRSSSLRTRAPGGIAY